MKKLILLLLLLSVGCIINAQINSIASGNWNNPGVWQGGQVPGPSDNVIINGHSITLNVAAEVNDLTLNNATLSGNNDMTINGHFIWNGGSISGTGVIWSYGSALLTGGQKSLSSKTIRLVGESLWDTGNILSSNAFLVVWAGGELTISVPANSTLNYQQNGSAASLHNYGQIIKTGGGNFTHGFNTFFYNFNTGNLSIEGGIWTAGWHTELYNTIQLSENTELRNTNAMWLRGATITGEGYLVNTSTLRSTAVLSEVDNLKLQSGSISNETNNAQETINVMQNFIWTGGSLNSQQGRLNVYGYAHLTTTNTKTISERQFYIYGSGLWDAGIINAGFTGNVFWIEGTFEIHAAQGVDLSFQGTSGQFRNNGNITKTGPGNVIFGFSIGTIHFSGSVLNIEQGNYTHSSYCSFSGTMNISENAKFRNAGTAGAGTAVDISGAVIQGEGWFEIESGNLRLTTSTSSIENLKFISGDIYNVNSSETCPLSILNKFTWLGGKIYHPGNITISGHTHITGSNTKEISTNGRNIRIESTALWDGGLLVINNSGCGIVITNTGAMEVAVPQNTTLTTQGSSFDGGHFINNGVLTKSGQGKLSFGFRSHYFGTAGSTTNIHDGETDFGWYVEFRSLTNIANNSILRTTGGTTKIWMNGCTFEGEGWFINQSEIRVSGTNAVNLDNLNLKSGSIANNNSNSENTTVNVNGEFLWEAGSIYHTGTITVNGHAHLTGSGNKEISTNGRNLRIEGTALWDQGILIKTEGGCGIIVASTGEFEIAVPQNSTLTAQGGPWAGGHWFNYGTIRKTGLGTFTSGFRHHFVNYGTLSGVGTYNFTWHLENYGFIEPGLSVGELNINWGSTSFPFGNNGGLNIELLDNSGPGTGHDRAIFSNNVALNGTLNVTELESMPNGSYTILTCNGGANCRTGTFSFTDLPDCFSVQYTGNSVILVKDDQSPPEIVGCPDDVTINTDPGQCYAVYNITDPQASDDCLLASLEGNMPPLNQFPVGLTVVTFIATDGSGNSSSCTFEVTVEDTQSPIITGCPTNMIVQTSTSCTAIVSWTEPQATDNCELSSFEGDTTNGEEYGLGIFTVNYIATDLYNNTSTCTFSVSVVDQSNPIITNCPTNIAMSADEGTCTATVSWEEPSAMDNCGIQSFVGDGDNGGSYTTTVTTITYIAIDVNGNQSTCTFTITVTDSEEPVINNCPEDIDVNTNAGTCVTTVSWSAPTATDNCGEPTLESSHSNGGTYELGPTLVTYTATDGGGLMSTCSFTINVIDIESPIITDCPEDINVNTNEGLCVAIVNWDEPTANDNCGVQSFVGDGDNGGNYGVGTSTVIYTATDASNNQTNCSFSITVSDDQSPEILGCPDDIEITTIVGQCFAIANWTEPSAIDNCGEPELVGDGNNGGNYPVGSTLVTYLATDVNGQSSTCTFNINVTDNELPMITNCPTNIVMSADEGTCTATVSWEEPSANDNCGIQSFVGDGDNGGSYTTTVTTITYIAIDVNGNQSTCTFTITVTDSEEPVINNCPEDIDVNTNAGTCVTTVSWSAPTATDNCGEPTLESSHSNGGTYELGSTLITYTATDGGGLMSTCSFTINVIDIESPIITDCPEDINVNTNEGLCVAIVNWDEPTANDNCGVQSFVGDGDNGGNYGVGTSTVTYTATDGSNNQTNCSFSITVSDDQSPEILGCPDDIEITTIAGQCFAIANWTEPSAIDNCGEPELVGDGNNGGNYSVGSTLVTYLATDVNGQYSTCTFNINVTDNELPMITNCPQNIEVPTDFGQCTAIVSWTEPEATDNCGVESYISSQTNGGAYPIGVTQVNYTATDAQGNTAQCSFTITVLDEFIITCPDDVTVCIDGNEILLTGAEPSGGVFSGNGVIDGIFYPSEAGVGIHFILYELQIGECISNCTFFIVVTPLPVVLCPENFEVCIVDQPFELLLANPQGGLYTGPGVTANVFDPTDAGLGTHEISYSFTDTNDCESSCDFSINVYAQTLWYADTDGDGFGDPEESLLACEQPEGYVSNNLDNCPQDFNKIDEGQCGCGIADTDTDGDGTADCNDECPLDPEKVNPGQCGCGLADTDTDSDGVADCNDECPLDPNKVNPGVCGCGISDIDTDGDGTADCNDECPLDPDKINPGQCGCGIADTDTDGDGVADCNDECPLDPNKINPGQCGCGIADTDTDGDGVADCNDECPLDPTLTIAPTWYADADGDGFGDASNFMVSCLQPEGYVSNNLDCNDSDADINPNAIEACNGFDDNCDGIIDEGCSVPGCLDPEAHNYNPEATDDDGSCETCTDQIKNGDETGVDCGGIKCPVCPGDDFFVTYPTLSKEIVEPGETLLASVLHHYSGAEPSVFAYVGFYLSEDDQLDQSDILLNDELSTLGYYNGFDYESGNLEIPANTVEGNYFILFVADYNQLYTEIDENNNLLSRPITVQTLPAGDDFFITEAAVSATTVSPGGTISASCLQNYSGSSESTLNVTMGYYYSTDAIWDASDVLLNTDESTLSASDTADEEDATITIPISAVAGTAYILFVADHNDTFEETDEDNNVSAIAITIVAPPVGNDFFITNAATNHAQRNPGQSLSMTCHQSYAGSSFSPLVVRMGYYLSTDDQFNAGDVLLGTDNSGLSATKTSEYEDLTRNIPFGTAHGYYYILFVADDNGIYAETNENNNTVAIPITIGNPPLLREVNHGQNIMSTNFIHTNETEIFNEDKAYVEIQVSPNPFSQFIHLNWASYGDLESVNCVIRDHTGRLVANFKNVTPGGYLETDNLISGMYVLEVFTTAETLINRYRVIKVE